MKSDQGFAIVELQYDIKEERARTLDEVGIHVQSVMGNDDNDEDIVVIEHCPVGESESNGAVENASKILQGQIRIL